MMRDHGVIGRHYAGAVTQIISGLDRLRRLGVGRRPLRGRPVVFKKLIYEMRFDEASAWYAEFGPFYVGPAVLAGRAAAVPARARCPRSSAVARGPARLYSNAGGTPCSPVLQAHFADYAAFHGTPGNKACHYVGIPLIVLTLFALLAQVPLFAAGRLHGDAGRGRARLARPRTT